MLSGFVVHLAPFSRLVGETPSHRATLSPRPGFDLGRAGRDLLLPADRLIVAKKIAFRRFLKSGKSSNRVTRLLEPSRQLRSIQPRSHLETRYSAPCIYVQQTASPRYAQKSHQPPLVTVTVWRSDHPRVACPCNLSLQFAHYWGRSRRGKWVVKRKTANSRLKRALAALSEWCGKNPHDPIKEQHEKLVQKLRGHYAYYGIIGNLYSLLEFREGVRSIWRRKLSRRRRDGEVTWAQFLRLEKRYSLPRARVVHGLQSSVAKS